MKHLWFGKLIDKNELNIRLENILDDVSSALEGDLTLDYLMQCLNAFGESLIRKDLNFLANLPSSEFSVSEAEEVLNDIGNFCKRDHLLTKVGRELGTDNLNDLSRIDFERNLFESWAPLGTLVHIAPGNSPGLGFLALVEGLLTGNVNILKLSSRDSDFAISAFLELFKFDTKDLIKNKVAILRISSKEKSSLGKILSVADGVSAWGGEEAIKGLRDMAPSTARFIPWGHKISFGMVTKAGLDNESELENLAMDCVLMEQQACSSPQTILAEVDSFKELNDFADTFSKYVESASSKFPFPNLEIQEQAEITNIVEVIRLESVDQEKRVIQASDKSWRLLVENSSGLGLSPLHRTVWIKPFKRKNIVRELLPLRGYLQTCGLVGNRDEMGEIVPKLVKAGVLRITPAGEMTGGYDGEPHDGVYALSRFMNRVRAEINGLEDIWRISSLNEIENETPSGEVMGKVEFQSQKPVIEKSQLFFRSGGSSGEPSLSPFSYDDYHAQMLAAAEGLLAAGLEPAKDKVINLFFGGGLYGGFVSFFTILEKLNVVQFPMAAHEDYEFVGETINRNKINVLVGMPSYLIQLFKANEELFKKGKTIEKIFYGGEHISEKQRKWLEDEFEIKVIRSASYGSVDAGPLGYQCIHCQGSVHHLNHTLHNMEILELDSDQPVEEGETGRLVFTSKKRDSISIQRYDVGDLGRWVSGPCACGRKVPTFELQGRQGDIFRAGGTFLNFKALLKILVDKSEFGGEAQVVISNENGRDLLEFRLDQNFIQGDVSRDLFLNEYRDLRECVVAEDCLEFNVVPVSGEELLRTPGSGKLRRVVDLR